MISAFGSRMPFGVKPVCSSCKITSSNRWHRDSDRQALCNTCYTKPAIKEESNQENTNSAASASGNAISRNTRNSKGLLGSTGSQYAGPVRKSARLKPSRQKYQAVIKPLATKGKSRRLIFKKNPIRAPTSVATIVTSEYVFYKGIYWQVGDIVSVMDEEGGIYYAQLRGFLQDQFCVKSAVITWLLPTMASPAQGFNPSTYILGPEEDLPRTMDCFDFVCRAPSEYFKAKSSPYPTVPSQPELGYIWTHMGAEVLPVPSNEELYGLKSVKDETKMEAVREKKEKDKTEKNAKKEKKETGKDKRDSAKTRRDSTKEKKERKETKARSKPEPARLMS